MLAHPARKNDSKRHPQEAELGPLGLGLCYAYLHQGSLAGVLLLGVGEKEKQILTEHASVVEVHIPAL